jgi:hypothetical protein
MKDMSRPQSKDPADDFRKYRRLRDVGILLAAIVFGIIAINWTLNDITGEYTAVDPQLGTLSMSLIRKAANIRGELSCGTGAILEATVPESHPENELDLTFQLPQKWINEGQTYRRVEFHGRVQDGSITGVLQENGQVYPIKLERNALSSIYRQIQSHLPWLG